MRCEHDEYDLAEIIRALDAEDLHFANLQLHAPSLDDVFLEKTGRTLEGATAEADAEAERRAGVSAIVGADLLAGAPLGRAPVAPAGERRRAGDLPARLLAVNAGGLQPATMIPGFPTDRFVAFALAVPFMQGALFATMNAGTDLARDIQTGFLNRLSLTPVRGVALITGQLAGVAVVALVQAVIYIVVGYIVGVHLASGAAGIVMLLLLAVAIAIAFGGGGPLHGAPHRLGRGRSRGSSRCCSSSC